MRFETMTILLSGFYAKISTYNQCICKINGNYNSYSETQASSVLCDFENI